MFNKCKVANNSDGDRITFDVSNQILPQHIPSNVIYFLLVNTHVSPTIWLVRVEVILSKVILSNVIYNLIGSIESDSIHSNPIQYDFSLANTHASLIGTSESDAIQSDPSHYEF